MKLCANGGVFPDGTDVSRGSGFAKIHSAAEELSGKKVREVPCQVCAPEPYPVLRRKENKNGTRAALTSCSGSPSQRRSPKQARRCAS